MIDPRTGLYREFQVALAHAQNRGFALPMHPKWIPTPPFAFNFTPAWAKETPRYELQGSANADFQANEIPRFMPGPGEFSIAFDPNMHVGETKEHYTQRTDSWPRHAHVVQQFHNFRSAQAQNQPPLVRSPGMSDLTVTQTGRVRTKGNDSDDGVAQEGDAGRPEIDPNPQA